MQNGIRITLALVVLLGAGCSRVPSSWQPIRSTSLNEGWTRSVYSMPFPTRKLVAHAGRLYIHRNRREIIEIQVGKGQDLLQVKHTISSRENLGKASALANGEIYVVDSSSRSILVLSFDGEISKRLNVPTLGRRQPHISALVFDSSTRRLWGTDSSNHRILVWEPQRSIDPLFVVGKRGNGALEFNYPVDIAIEPSGSILVLDRMNHRVQRLTSSGQFAGFLLGGMNSLHRPTAIAVETQGDIWVYDSFSHALLAFSAEGQVRRTQNGSALRLDGPTGCTSLQIDMHDRIWLADALSETITMIEVDDTLNRGK